MTAEAVVEITFDYYQKVGGFKAAIDCEAEAVLALFPDEQKQIEKLFQRITEKGAGEKPIRKPQKLTALAEITELSAARLNEIVYAFAAHDLLVLRELDQEGVEVDLPHECLEWKWERLKNWIDQEVARAESLDFLKESAEKKQWVTGAALAEAQGLLEDGWLDGAWPRRYISSSEVAAVKELVEKSERRDQAERLRGKRRAIATIIAVVLIAAGSVVFFYKQKARTLREELQKQEYARTQRENQIFNKRADADSFRQDGERLRQTGKYYDCLKDLQQALRLYQDLDTSKEQIATQIDIADVYALMGHFADAKSAYNTARQTAKEKRATDLEGKALELLASVTEQDKSEQNQQQTKALDYYAEALQAYQLAGDSEASGRVLEKLGFEAKGSHHLKEANEFYRNALRSYTDSGNELGKLRVAEALKTVREDLGAWGFLVDLLSGQTYDLKGTSVTVGRNVEGIRNDISVPNRMVSRRHLTIAGNLHIDDMRSTNGTSINGQVLPYGIGATLSDQDIVVVANVVPLRFSIHRPQSPLKIPGGAWAVLIDSASKSADYLNAQEYSLDVVNGRLALQSGSSISAVLRVRQGKDKPQMMVTSSTDWTVIFTVKQTDYEYKTYIAKGGDWEDPLDIPLNLVKLSPDEKKKILVEGPALQIVFFQSIDK